MKSSVLVTLDSDLITLYKKERSNLSGKLNELLRNFLNKENIKFCKACGLEIDFS